MSRVYSAAELADEVACVEERVLWLAATGLIQPDPQERFTLVHRLGDRLILVGA